MDVTLQPLPPIDLFLSYENVLASFYCRAEDVLAETLRAGSRLQLSPDAEGVLSRLRRVMANGAIAYGNLRERGAHLDPDPFAVEVGRAARCQMNVPKDIDWVVKKLQESNGFRVIQPFINFEYLDDDQKRRVRVQARMLEKGGVRVVGLPGEWT